MQNVYQSPFDVKLAQEISDGKLTICITLPGKPGEG
jgi:hypothetical protein